MGYKKKTKVYVIKNLPGYDGLEIRMRGLTTQEVIDFMKNKNEFIKAAEKKDEESIEIVVGMLAAYTLSWNMEDEDDTPIEFSETALRQEDVSMILAWSNAWMDTLLNVDDDTKKD